MDTTDALSALVSWQFILFALAVFVIVWFFRTIFEYFFPKLDNNTLWEKLILPLAPVIVGTLLAYFAKTYPYPANLTGLLPRLMIGGVGGMFSGLIYQVLKGLIKDKIQSYLTPTLTPNAPTVVPDAANQNPADNSPTGLMDK